MNNIYYFVRHAHSTYTHNEWTRPLSQRGRASLSQLNVLKKEPISAIYSSPYQRAIETVESLALALGLPVHLDKRLIERKLSNQNIPTKRLKLRLNNFGKILICLYRAANPISQLKNEHELFCKN